MKIHFVNALDKNGNITNQKFFGCPETAQGNLDGLFESCRSNSHATGTQKDVYDDYEFLTKFYTDQGFAYELVSKDLEQGTTKAENDNGTDVLEMSEDELMEITDDVTQVLNCRDIVIGPENVNKLNNLLCNFLESDVGVDYSN